MAEKQAEAKWRRRERADGDPVWQGHLGDFALQVSVPTGSPWFFEWCVIGNDCVELARGNVYVEHEDEEEDDWDYQGVEGAMLRCETVALALILEVTL